MRNSWRRWLRAEAEDILAKVIVGVAEIGLSEVLGYGVLVGDSFLKFDGTTVPIPEVISVPVC